jgi:cysteine desulfurase
MAVKLPIYMDYHATTPVDPRVVEAMLPYFTEHFGNAASRNHPFGWEAEEAVDKARKQVADLIGANAKEIVFTSGATESDNLAIKGVAEMYREKGNHIITCVTEHKAVIDTCKRSRRRLPRDLSAGAEGRPHQPRRAQAAITDKTILISIMAANNEIGVVQPIAEIGAIAKEKGDPVPHRRRAGGGEDPVQRQRPEGGHGVHQRAQDVRTEGRRCALTCAAGIPRACWRR